jgi:hypothetical protein
MAAFITKRSMLASVLPLLFQGALCASPITFAVTWNYDPTVTVKGDNNGTAAAGKNDAGKDTSAVQLKTAQDYVSRYNGATEFKGDYTIVLKPDKTVDPTKSTVTFITVNYTSSGKLVKSNFTTQPITITGVTLKDDSIASFMLTPTTGIQPMLRVRTDLTTRVCQV